MGMFELALKAGIPIIGVHTDDMVNVLDVLTFYNPKASLLPLVKGKPMIVYDSRTFWTTDSSLVTAEAYASLQAKGASLIVVNPEYGNSLIFDTGALPTPDSMLLDYLKESVEAAELEETARVLRGLSLKVVDQVCRLTVARDHHYTIAGLRKTRTSLLGATQGLQEVSTTYDFYLPPAKLEKWLQLNAEYFLKSDIPQLRPRGLLLDGPPGVGKSLAAKYLAKELGVPLFRMDIASALNKYIGVSEKQIQRMLETAEHEAPAVLLVDEVEKIFSATDDGTGTMTRIMSQMLWWLSEHQSRVLTVMTTNDMEKIPAELYREGRVDMTLRIQKLSAAKAFSFMALVLTHILGKKPSPHQLEACTIALKLSGNEEFSHAEVRGFVYDTVKKNKWVF